MSTALSTPLPLGTPAAQPELELLEGLSAELRDALTRAGLEGPATQAWVARGADAARVLLSMRAPLELARAALYAPAQSALHAPDNPRPGLTLASGGVAEILDGVERLSAVDWDRIDAKAAETLRKLFLAMARDVRVVLVALALRVAELGELARAPGTPPFDARSTKLARECLQIFAPLANRLGIWQLKWQLEDLALSIVEPESYRTIQQLLSEKGEQRDAFVRQVEGALSVRLSQEGIPFRISGRAKHVFSIYRKMQKKQVGFDEIYDLSAVRVVTERVADCYAVLGIVHELWTPLPGEFDDYIALPKSNGYQSLHTAVLGPGGRPVEVQIRTQEMHRFAELGVAAHWAYKEQQRARPKENERLLLLRRLLDWERELTDPEQFVDSLRTSMSDDEVFVFTPEGDVVDLPRGATPVDFAYRVHTMVGHRCKGARINGQIAALDTKLKTGDRVEILTQREPKPNRDWMNPALGFTASPTSRAKVRHWFRQKSREQAIVEGRELVHAELSRLPHGVATLEHIARALHYDSIDDLCAAVGQGHRRVQSVAEAALDLNAAAQPAPPWGAAPSAEPIQRAPARGLTLHGISDVLARRGACCSPVPGDDVVGFVTRGRGVVIHRRDCNQVATTSEPQRLVEIEWHPERDDRVPVEIEVQVLDSENALAEVSSKVTSFGATVLGVHRATSDAGLLTLRLTLACRNTKELADLLSRLARQSDVFEVRRLSA